MTLGLAVIFKNFENFTCFSLFFTLNSSPETNSGIHQNACRSRCLITPLYLTLSLLCHPWPTRTLYYLTFFNVTCVWLRNLYLDFETQITITKSKNRNLSSRWLLNPDFVDFLLYSSIGKSRKGIEKLFLWTLVLLTLLIHECVKLLFLRRVLFGSPKEMKERKIHEQFSQCWNSVLDFTFDCKSKSRFSNLMHP